MSIAVIGRIPLDDDRNPVLGGLSNADGVTAIPAYIDSATNAVLVKVASGGSSGTQYVELATTSPATGTLALGRYQTSLPTLTNGQMNEPMLDSSSRLLVTASGDVASGSSDSGNPIKVGGRYNSTPPTLTNGQRGDLQLDSSGNLKVNAAAMSGATDSVAINDGTNTANVKSIASGNNALVVTQGYMEQTGLSAGSLNADLIASVDVSNYEEVALQVTGTFSGTLTTQFSNDNSTFVSYSSTTATGAGTGNTITATGMYRITPMGRYMRVRMTAYTSGTATGVAEFYTLSTKPTLSAQYSVAQSGTWTVQPGNTANTTPWLVSQISTTPTLTNVASSASNVTLLASNASAKSRIVYNESTAVLYLKYGATASATSYTTQVPANSLFEFPQPTYTGQVDGIWASANGNARVTEVV